MDKTINKNERFQKGINSLCKWTRKKGWDVEFDTYHYDQMDSHEKLITICTRFGVEKQLYAFLHECGHLLVRQTPRVFEAHHPVQAKSEAIGKNKRLERTAKYKVDVLAEEIEAWNRGLKLSKRLKIDIDENKYRDHMTECVFSYIKWAAESK